MSVKVSKKAYRTLTLFLFSCHSTVGEEVLKAYFNYEGIFPATFRQILGNFDWTIDTIPDNVFLKLEQYAESNGSDVLTSELIAIYFGSTAHLETAKNSCIFYKDLSREEKIAGHLTLPVIITSVTDGNITGKVVYNNLFIENIVNSFKELTVGDIVLIHFSTVVMIDPSTELVDKLEEMQKDFSSKHLAGLAKITYSSTSDQARDKIEKYF